jgi:putative oxidoreductase
VIAEFLGPLGLAIGLLTRVAALGIAVVMLVAILGHKQRTHLLALGMAVALIVNGAGASSIDALIAR